MKNSELQSNIKCMNGGTYGDTCEPCPDNYNYSNSNVPTIGNCQRKLAAGYEMIFAYAEPTKCSKGYYSEERIVNYGSSSRCTWCGSGKTTNDMGATSINDCIDANNSNAPITPEKDNIDLSKIKCSPGTGWSDQEGKCIPCSGNTIQKYTAHRSCEACPSGKTANKAKTNCDLTSCNLGYYIENGKCEKCSKGHYCDGKNSKVCDDGSYQDEVGQSSCKQCEGNKKSNSDHTSCVNKTSSSGNSNTNIVQEKCYRDSNNDYVVGNYDNQVGYVYISDSIINCNNIKIKKIDSNNVTLAGGTIVFEEVLNPNNNRTFIIGETDISMLNSGSYLIKETIAPIGYSLETNEIRVTVNGNGTITINSNANINLNATNGTRNIKIDLINILDSTNNEEEKCYVKHEKDGFNTYCYGDNTTCPDYEETIEGRNKDTCDEELACFQKQDGSFVTGKYSNQNEYQYFGMMCPACYEKNNGDYYWTNTPLSNEKLIKEISLSNMCYAPQKNSSKLIYLILLILVVIILFVVIKFRKNKNNNSFSTDY